MMDVKTMSEVTVTITKPTINNRPDRQDHRTMGEFSLDLSNWKAAERKAFPCPHCFKPTNLPTETLVELSSRMQIQVDGATVVVNGEKWRPLKSWFGRFVCKNCGSMVDFRFGW